MLSFASITLLLSRRRLSQYSRLRGTGGRYGPGNGVQVLRRSCVSLVIVGWIEDTIIRWVHTATIIICRATLVGVCILSHNRQACESMPVEKTRTNRSATPWKDVPLPWWGPSGGEGQPLKRDDLQTHGGPWIQIPGSYTSASHSDVDGGPTRSPSYL
jgi:hypothetical protein